MKSQELERGPRLRVEPPEIRELPRDRSGWGFPLSHSECQRLCKPAGNHLHGLRNVEVNWRKVSPPEVRHMVLLTVQTKCLQLRDQGRWHVGSTSTNIRGTPRSQGESFSLPVPLLPYPHSLATCLSDLPNLEIPGPSALSAGTAGGQVQCGGARGRNPFLLSEPFPSYPFTPEAKIDRIMLLSHL